MKRLLIVLLLCGVCSAAIVKGQAGKIAFAAVDSTGAYKTGDAANITAYRAIDGATSYTALADTGAAEAGTSGVYWFDLSADDTNGDMIIYYATSTTSGVTLDRVVVSTIIPADYKATGFALASDWTATRAGYVDKLNVTGTLANTDNASSFKATGFSTHSAADVWAVGTRALTDKAGFSLSVTPPTAQNIWEYGTRALTDKAGFSLASPPLDAAGVRSAVGLASANLDTQLTALSGYVDCLPPTLTIPTPQNIWEYGTRTLTSVGSGGATAQEVWEYGTRSLTNKTGFSLATPPPTATTIADSVWDALVPEHLDELSFGWFANQTYGSAVSIEEAIGVAEGELSVSLGSENIDAIVNGLMSRAIDSTVTFQDAQKLLLAVLSGKTTGGGTTELKFYDPTGTKARLTATVDDNGNRTITIRNVAD